MRFCFVHFIKSYAANGLKGWHFTPKNEKRAFFILYFAEFALPLHRFCKKGIREKNNLLHQQ